MDVISAASAGGLKNEGEGNAQVRRVVGMK